MQKNKNWEEVQLDRWQKKLFLTNSQNQLDIDNCQTNSIDFRSHFHFDLHWLLFNTLDLLLQNVHLFKLSWQTKIHHLSMTLYHSYSPSHMHSRGDKQLSEMTEERSLPSRIFNHVSFLVGLLRKCGKKIFWRPSKAKKGTAAAKCLSFFYTCFWRTESFNEESK